MKARSQPEGSRDASQMSAVDWRRVVATYLEEHPQARVGELSRALGCTEAQALSGLSERVWDLRGVELATLLAEIAAWGKVLVLVRNADAVAEVEVSADAGSLKGEWLNWIEQGYNLHIYLAATQRVLGLVRPGKHGLTYSFNLVNSAGQVFCRFYARTPEAKESFLSFCLAHTPELDERYG